MRPLVTQIQEVPQALLPDRPADAAGEVPQLQQSPGHPETCGAEFGRVIVIDEALANPRDVDRSLDRVAAGLRHDAESRTGDLCLAEASRNGEGDLLRVGDVGVVSGHAAAVACGTHAEAVDLQ